MASVVHDEASCLKLPGRPPLLLYLARADDLQRLAVAPALAAAAERSGWGFELYYDALRRGRHFGGGDSDRARPGTAGGSPPAGGGHVEQLAWLAAHYAITAVGDPDALLWPVLERLGVEGVVRSRDPAEIYAAVYERLQRPIPSTVRVLDGAPQGPRGLILAPYLYPDLLVGAPALAVEASGDGGVRERLERLGAASFSGLGVSRERARAFPGGLDEDEPLIGGGVAGPDAASVGHANAEEDYAALTARLADRHRAWGTGVLLGDPQLVAAQLPKARRLRLLPLYGRPQTDVIAEAGNVVRQGRDPVFGRQYDDRDFFSLASEGRGLQVLDAGPPFDAMHACPAPVPAPRTSQWALEPDDAQLVRWADEGRVLVTLLLWSGMLRELDCLPRLFDLVAETGLRAGLVITAETLENAPSALSLLASPSDRGGVLGLLEPLLASTGRGVAAEVLLPEGVLASALRESVEVAERCLPLGLRPRGWWPLLDAPLLPHRSSRLGWSGRRPVLRFTPRGSYPATSDLEVDARPGSSSRQRTSASEGAAGSGRPSRHRDVRAIVGDAVRGAGLDRFLEEWRPFERFRPGQIDERVAEGVRSAGFTYMFTKAGFGAPRVVRRRGDFVALPSTAGQWDGWSPFYTVSSVGDVLEAERRLSRAGKPGWLVSTVDGPLWALPGEVWEHGAELHRIAALAAAGGKSGALVNVTPHVVARYARLLDERAQRAEGHPGAGGDRGESRPAT